MASGIEDDGLKDLLSWLLSTLKSNSGSVDRAGAAQGKLTFDNYSRYVADVHYLNAKC